MSLFFKELYYAVLEGTYQGQLSLLTMFFLWLLVRIDQNRTAYFESVALLQKFCSEIYYLDQRNIKFLTAFLQKVKVNKPHVIFSSLKQFDLVFKRLFLLVDKKRRLFGYKAKLLYVYGFLRDKFHIIRQGINHKDDRRKFLRYNHVRTVYYTNPKEESPQEGLLLNISGGGARFFVKSKVKKGQQLRLHIDRDSLTTITANVLDVARKADFSVVRAKFTFAYPSV